MKALPAGLRSDRDNRQEVVMNDETIVSLLLARDEKAISIIKTKYEKTLKQIASNLLFDRRDVEECLLDTYLEVWNSVPPDKPDHLGGYLCTVLRKNAIDRIRKNTSKKRGGNVIDVPWEECENIAEKTQDMDQFVESARVLDIINRYLKAASRRRCAVFVGRYYFGQTVKVIAKELSIGKTTVNAELAAIRKELGELLVEGGDSK